MLTYFFTYLFGFDVLYNFFKLNRHFNFIFRLYNKDNMPNITLDIELTVMVQLELVWLFQSIRPIL